MRSGERASRDSLMCCLAGVTVSLVGLAVVNSFVHIVMYAYFLTTALGQKPPDSMRKQITRLQVRDEHARRRSSFRGMTQRDAGCVSAPLLTILLALSPPANRALFPRALHRLCSSQLASSAEAITGRATSTAFSSPAAGRPSPTPLVGESQGPYAQH